VIVTAHPQVRDADGFEVIYKPLDFDAFLERVHSYLDQTPAVSPGVRTRASVAVQTHPHHES
jgi:hypothetical protein